MSTRPLFRPIILIAIVCTGCIDAGSHAASLHSSQEREMTVGIVQREIRQGMSAAEVAEQLGSPNIVTKDSGSSETWIYDKIATEASYSRSGGSASGSMAGGGMPGSSLILGLITGDYYKQAGAAATTQKTLTVIIKFDQANRVRSFSYHSSKF